MRKTYELVLQDSITKLDSLSMQCKNEMESWGKLDTNVIIKSASSLDAWDYCFSIAIGIAGAKISTSEQLENYLNDVHHAASGATGDYTKLQEFLGSLLRHQGDAIDKPWTEKQFINRAYEPADVGYHRLLWGHDIINLGVDNPFRLMFEQQGISGILQAVRHLVADTTSRQGLPLPGSATFDYIKDNGKVSNYLLELAKIFQKNPVETCAMLSQYILTCSR